MNRLLILIPILLFALFIFLARNAKYTAYHKSKINGKIDTIYRYRDYVMLNISNIEYRIIPVPLNDNRQLDVIGVKGDSIYKNTNSDTLKLFHDGQQYFYTVKRY